MGLGFFAATALLFSRGVNPEDGIRLLWHISAVGIVVLLIPKDIAKYARGRIQEQRLLAIQAFLNRSLAFLALFGAAFITEYGLAIYAKV